MFYLWRVQVNLKINFTNVTFANLMEYKTWKILVTEDVLNARFYWPTFRNEEPKCCYAFVELDLEYFTVTYMHMYVSFWNVLSDLFR